MIEVEIKTEILKNTEVLNLEIYTLFCKLDRYKDKLTEATYRYMADKLYLLYREEFERMTANYLIERAQKKYEYKKRFGRLVPRESWLFRRKNRAAKYFFKKVCAEQNECFSKLKAQLGAVPAQESKTGANDQSPKAAPANSPKKEKQA